MEHNNKKERKNIREFTRKNILDEVFYKGYVNCKIENIDKFLYDMHQYQNENNKKIAEILTLPTFQHIKRETKEYDEEYPVLRININKKRKQKIIKHTNKGIKINI